MLKIKEGESLMKELHESGLFFCKRGNGFHTNKIPAGVRCFRVIMEDGSVVEMFRKKVFYLGEMATLEVELLSGEKRLFRHEQFMDKLVEVNEMI